MPITTTKPKTEITATATPTVTNPAPTNNVVDIGNRVNNTNNQQQVQQQGQQQDQQNGNNTYVQPINTKEKVTITTPTRGTITDKQAQDFVKNNLGLDLKPQINSEAIARTRLQQEERIKQLQNTLAERKRKIQKQLSINQGSIISRNAGIGGAGSASLQGALNVEEDIGQEKEDLADAQYNADVAQVNNEYLSQIDDIENRRSIDIERGFNIYNKTKESYEKEYDNIITGLIDKGVQLDIDQLNEIPNDLLPVLSKLGLDPEAYLTQVRSKGYALGKAKIAATPKTQTVKPEILKLSPGQVAYFYNPETKKVERLADNPKAIVNSNNKGNLVVDTEYIPNKYLKDTNQLDRFNDNNSLINKALNSNIYELIDKAEADGLSSNLIANILRQGERYVPEGSRTASYDDYNNLAAALTTITADIRRAYAGLGVTGNEQLFSENYLPTIGRDSIPLIREKLNRAVDGAKINLDNIENNYKQSGGKGVVRADKVKDTIPTTTSKIRELPGGVKYTIN